MPRCAGVKPDSTRCSAIVDGSQRYCYQHDPARADERSRNASRAARSKPHRALRDIQAEIRSVIDDVRAGEIDRRDAVAMFTGFNTLLRALEQARRWREIEELEERMSEIEDRLASRGRARGF